MRQLSAQLRLWFHLVFRGITSCWSVIAPGHCPRRQPSVLTPDGERGRLVARIVQVRCFALVLRDAGQDLSSGSLGRPGLSAGRMWKSPPVLTERDRGCLAGACSRHPSRYTDTHETRRDVSLKPRLARTRLPDSWSQGAARWFARAVVYLYAVMLLPSLLLEQPATPGDRALNGVWVPDRCVARQLPPPQRALLDNPTRNQKLPLLQPYIAPQWADSSPANCSASEISPA